MNEYSNIIADFSKGRKLELIKVSAKMPNSCWGRYAHLRIFPAGSTLPKGAALRKLREGSDYIEFSKLCVDHCGPKSEYGKIVAAFEEYNESVQS